jgi:hypothetical protein
MEIMLTLTSMMLSAWFAVAWFFSRGASAMRPSALQRMYALMWLFAASFALLAFVTVLANNYQIAGGYFALFYFAGIFSALVLSYLELFFAPTKTAFTRHFSQADESTSRPLTSATSVARPDDRQPADDDATETTSLLRGDRRSFARYADRRDSTDDTNDDHREEPQSLDLKQPYPGEQEWSGRLPGWIWVLQLLLMAPVAIVLVGQIALLVTSALHQTSADGNSSLMVYLVVVTFATLLLAPIGPFIHRFTFHVPAFVFLICIATVIYNLVAFPFSR